MESFKIVRFHFQGESEVMSTGLSLAEAQAWCKRDDTHGNNWFDGYSEDDAYISADDWDQVGVTEKIEPESGKALASHAGVPILILRGGLRC